MYKEQYSRTIALLGEDSFDNLSNKTVMVIGLGGVGGTALEALVRTGIKHIIAVDYDAVHISNLNRQILFNYNDIDKLKTECAKKHLLAIEPNLDITVINQKIDSQSIDILNKYHVDFIVDAIDDVNAKVEISKYALTNNIPLIISLGMANRLDPNLVEIIRLDKTTDDPLAKKFRYEIKKAGLDTRSLMCVLSKEKPKKEGNALNSIMSVPSSAGLNIASYVINYFTKEGKHNEKHL